MINLQKSAFEIVNLNPGSNPNSKILLKNCGFPPEFFNDLETSISLIKNSNIKKIKSENDIILLKNREIAINEKKIYEAEDKDIYLKRYSNSQTNLYDNYNISNFNISSSTTIPSQEYLNNKNNIDTINQNNDYMVKAYKSKLKKKFRNLYEFNSVLLENRNKYKLYHKCCYPGCNRTFSSSGWLRAHLKYHLKQISNSKYCKLFKKYIYNENLEKINNEKKLLLESKNDSLNNLASPFFYPEYNIFKQPNFYFNNENDSNLFVNNSYINFNSDKKYEKNIFEGVGTLQDNNIILNQFNN